MGKANPLTTLLWLARQAQERMGEPPSVVRMPELDFRGVADALDALPRAGVSSVRDYPGYIQSSIDVMVQGGVVRVDRHVARYAHLLTGPWEVVWTSKPGQESYFDPVECKGWFGSYETSLKHVWTPLQESSGSGRPALAAPGPTEEELLVYAVRAKLKALYGRESAKE